MATPPVMTRSSQKSGGWFPPGSAKVLLDDPAEVTSGRVHPEPPAVARTTATSRGISRRGAKPASGAPLAASVGRGSLVREVFTEEVREACWFGNLFTGEGVFGGPDHASWNSKTSTARACVFDTKYKDSTSQCAPIFQTNYCSSVCTEDPTKTFYESCTYNGKTYKALATRIQPSAVYTCGDGVCQSTESCGSGADWDNCKADCGLCP